MRMNEPDVLDVLERVGAFKKGHFVFTSGLHSDTYINKDSVYPYTRETSLLCRAFAEKFADKEIDVVVGPAVGAAILSQWTAHHLSEIRGKNVFGVYADKDGAGGFILKRGYDKVSAGKRVLVVEDLVTTGGSVKKVVDALRAIGAQVAGVAVLCNRGNVPKSAVGDPDEFYALVNVELDTWTDGSCPLCERHVPINTDMGHGKEYLAAKMQA